MFKFIISNKYADNAPLVLEHAYDVEHCDDYGDTNTFVSMSLIDFKQLLPQESGKDFSTQLDSIVALGRETSTNPDDYYGAYRAGLSKFLNTEMGKVPYMAIAAPIYRVNEPKYSFMMEEDADVSQSPIFTISNYNDRFKDKSVTNENMENIEEDRFFVEWYAKQSPKPNTNRNPGHTMVHGIQRTIKKSALNAARHNKFSLLAEIDNEIHQSIDIAETYRAFLTFSAFEGPEGLFNAMMMSSFMHHKEEMTSYGDTFLIARDMREQRTKSGIMLNPNPPKRNIPA